MAKGLERTQSTRKCLCQAWWISYARKWFWVSYASKPPTSDEFVSKQKAYYETALEYFTPARCMFESNFPVDKTSISYPVLWNAFKKLATSYSASEKDQLFYKTASTVYRITD